MNLRIKVTFKVRALSTLVKSKSGHWKNSILFSCFLVIDFDNFYPRIFQFTRFGFQYWRNSLASFTVFTIWKKNIFVNEHRSILQRVTLNDILKFNIQSGALWSNGYSIGLRRQGSMVQVPPADSLSRQIFKKEEKEAEKHNRRILLLEEKENKDKWMWIENRTCGAI